MKKMFSEQISITKNAIIPGTFQIISSENMKLIKTVYVLPKHNIIFKNKSIICDKINSLTQ